MQTQELSQIAGGWPAFNRTCMAPWRSAIKRPVPSNRPMQRISSLPQRGHPLGSGFGNGVRGTGADSSRQGECSNACRAKGTRVARRLFPRMP